MAPPSELSLKEIHNFMVVNGGKVTNHDLVKHFKKFLTNPATQGEARKQFKTYVNFLSTIKNENTEKYLVLRKKYINQCPPEESVHQISSTSASGNVASSSPASKKLISTSSNNAISTTTQQSADVLMSPGSRSTISDMSASFSTLDEQLSSPYREPPPYKPPPDVVVKMSVLEPETKEQYKECVDEFKHAMDAFTARQQKGSVVVGDGSRKGSVDNNSVVHSPSSPEQEIIESAPIIPPRKRNSSVKSDKSNEVLLVNSTTNFVQNVDDNNDKENNPIGAVEGDIAAINARTLEKQISVKEAMRKFNLIASEEEASKVASPPAKKKPEKKPEEMSNDNLLSSHPKAKEWLVSSARANYQELAKLASEHAVLVKLQDPTTTALHWAAKHGNEDVVKLIAGTHKADVNIQTGYTPLHLAMQFGRFDIFALLCNVYKADRDILDWNGKKPSNYGKTCTSVSASTFNKIHKARKKQSEKDLGFLRIGSLNVRVKKTTEAFSNFLGVGSTQTRIPSSALQYNRASAPPTATGLYFDHIHKTWGSADNLPQAKKGDTTSMPPPKIGSIKKRRQKRAAASGFRSVPTTPNQQRSNSIGTLSEHPKTESDSDSACGFDSNWTKGDGM